MNLKLTAVLGLGLSLLACGKCVAQDPNPLITWNPEPDSTDVGPVTLASGYAHSWQDGQCIQETFVDASVTEEWQCSVVEPATVQTQAALTWCIPECGTDSYACGVWAHATAQFPTGVQVNEEFSDEDCNGNEDNSGGPHAWPCGTGSAPV